MPYAPVVFAPADADADVRGAWADLLRTGTGGSPFASLAYAEAAGDAYGLAPSVVAVPDGAGGFRAGTVSFVRRRGPYRLGVVPPLTLYLPAVLAAPADDSAVHDGTSALDALLDALVPAAHAHALHLDPATADVRPALWRGWHARPLYTYRLALADADDLARGFSSSTRRTIRRARDAYSVERTDDAAPAVALCAAAYERHGRKIPGGTLAAQHLADAMLRADHARVYAATPRDADAPRAAVVVLHDDTTAFYWIAGSLPGDAMTVLLGDLLPRLHADGFETFDFVGANTASIAEFKRRFGPSLVSYHRLTRIVRPELRPLRRLLGYG